MLPTLLLIGLTMPLLLGVVETAPVNLMPASLSPCQLIRHEWRAYCHNLVPSVPWLTAWELKQEFDNVLSDFAEFRNQFNLHFGQS